MPRQHSPSMGSPPSASRRGQHIKMDVVGLKVKVAGDAVLDADTWMPQIAVGIEHKRASPGSIQSVYNFLGVKDSGTDLYVSATKLFLAQSLLVNATLRSTNANQNGLLGFGSAAPGKNGRSLQPEFSVAYLVSKNVAVGAEYRFKPNNLQALGASAGLGAGLREDDWKDLFVPGPRASTCRSHWPTWTWAASCPALPRAGARRAITCRPRPRFEMKHP